MCPFGPACGIVGVGFVVPRCPLASKPKKTCALFGVCLSKEDNDFQVALLRELPSAVEEFWCM